MTNLLLIIYMSGMMTTILSYVCAEPYPYEDGF